MEMGITETLTDILYWPYKNGRWKIENMDGTMPMTMSQQTVYTILKFLVMDNARNEF